MEKLLLLQQNKSAYLSQHQANAISKDANKDELSRYDDAIQYIWLIENASKLESVCRIPSQIWRQALRHSFKRILYHGPQQCVSSDANCKNPTNFQQMNVAKIIFRRLSKVQSNKKLYAFTQIMKKANINGALCRAAKILDRSLLRSSFRKVQFANINPFENSECIVRAICEEEISVIHQRPADHRNLSKIIEENSEISDHSVLERQLRDQREKQYQRQLLELEATLKAEIRQLKLELKNITDTKKGAEKQEEDDINQIVGQKFIRQTLQLEQCLEEARAICRQICLPDKEFQALKKQLFDEEDGDASF